jgi:hypothetical protein
MVLKYKIMDDVFGKLSKWLDFPSVQSFISEKVKPLHSENKQANFKKEVWKRL